MTWKLRTKATSKDKRRRQVRAAESLNQAREQHQDAGYLRLSRGLQGSRDVRQMQDAEPPLSIGTGIGMCSSTRPG